MRRVWVLLKGLPGWGVPGEEPDSGPGRTSDPEVIRAFMDEALAGM